MNKLVFILIPFVLPLSGCAFAYDVLRSEAEYACRNKVIADRDECLRRSAQPSFEEYQRQRERKKIKDQRDATSTPP